MTLTVLVPDFNAKPQEMEKINVYHLSHVVVYCILFKQIKLAKTVKVTFIGKIKSVRSLLRGLISTPCEIRRPEEFLCRKGHISKTSVYLQGVEKLFLHLLPLQLCLSSPLSDP